MRLLPLFGLLAPLTAVASAAEVTTEYTLTHKCERASKKGDTIKVHYIGTLQADGSEFDQSYKRGQPLSFTVGNGQVIKGWDNGLLGMCPGDKRRLTIPPEHGYGARAMGPIPALSTLIFETELVEIVGVPKEELVVVPAAAAAGGADGDEVQADKASEPEPKAEESAETVEATGTVAEKTEASVEEAKDTIKGEL